MKIYELPELQVLAFEIEDVITTSGGGGDETPTQPTGGYEMPED